MTGFVSGKAQSFVCLVFCPHPGLCALWEGLLGPELDEALGKVDPISKASVSRWERRERRGTRVPGRWAQKLSPRDGKGAPSPGRGEAS